MNVSQAQDKDRILPMHDKTSWDLRLNEEKHVMIGKYERLKVLFASIEVDGILKHTETEFESNGPRFTARTLQTWALVSLVLEIL